MVLPDEASDRRPGVLEHQDTLNIGTFEFLSIGRRLAMPTSHGKRLYLAGNWVKKNGLNTEEWQGRRARLALNGTGERRDDDGTSLSLEEGIDDGGLLATDVVVEAVPGLGVDGFTDITDDAKGAEVSVLDVRFAEATEETDGSRRGVEVRELVLVDRLPETGGRWVNGGGLEHGGGDTVCERAVDEITIYSSQETS